MKRKEGVKEGRDNKSGKEWEYDAIKDSVKREKRPTPEPPG